MTASSKAQKLIEVLQLKPHPEGGYFRETYRSLDMLPQASLPSVFKGDRCACTAIYYLLTDDTFSAIHKLLADESYHFYLGDPVELLLLNPDKSGEVIKLGNDPLSGEAPQVVVPSGVWQGSRVMTGGTFALLGTTMAPGFEFVDHLEGSRQELINEYPAFAEMITALTRS
jgi:predicted cupin superfamily sugar epimerase